MAVDTGKILVKGIARGEMHRVVQQLSSLEGIWNQRYNAVGLVLFTADQVIQITDMIAMLKAQLARQVEGGPV
jgi:hypothetical protein